MKFESSDYPALVQQLKTGDETFRRHDKPVPVTLLDFWRWSGSDLVNNALRGKIAEFIVAQALGLSATPRIEWEAYDLLSSSGTRIEVKSAAYLQSWSHKKLSTIRFSIPPTMSWDASINRYATNVERQSDVYIFCLLSHLDKLTIDPLNIDQWEFYRLATNQLNQACPTQKSISLQRLIRIGAEKLSYELLKSVGV